MTRSWVEHSGFFSGRHVVVTGAQGGIGRATAKAFADVGASVITVDRTFDEATRAASWLPRSTPDSVHSPVAMDFAETSSIVEGLGQIRSISRNIAALVNIAGVAEDALVHMVTPESIRRHMQINFEAHVQITQYITRLMLRTGGGSVVNVSSVTGMDGNPGQLAYGASKAAVVSATRTLSMELAPRGIRVNAVAPGVIDTNMNRALDEAARDGLMQRVSMRRIGKPEEVAATILWLCSPAASYVTGQTLRIDGCM
ncbi:MAG TPA: SDR family oxidoreductase [Actinobacteria bacterium]|nr:3-oxoacyl-[acyl-carrier-protein] reductase FabG [bacterium BMS3Bbin01]HDH25114.1 SDR family oxidoreductase [Actinomycetota bacterium]